MLCIHGVYWIFTHLLDFSPIYDFIINIQCEVCVYKNNLLFVDFVKFLNISLYYTNQFVVRRSKHINRGLIRYRLWVKSTWSAKLSKSFSRNFSIKDYFRISFLIKSRYFNSQHKFYKSQNKLQCFLHYSFSVPSQRLRLSRFFLTKSVESLCFGGYQK